jgi:AraC family transcriptional regulator of arabinose operon
MRSEALAPNPDALLTGHFHEGREYSTWRSQGTRDDLLIYTVAGAGRFGTARDEFHAAPGDAVLLRAGAAHDYATLEDHWELLWVHFRPRAHWEGWLRWTGLAPGVLHCRVPDARAVETALLEMHRWATAGDPHREDWAMNALERVLLLCLPADCPPTAHRTWTSAWLERCVTCAPI